MQRFGASALGGWKALAGKKVNSETVGMRLISFSWVCTLLLGLTCSAAEPALPVSRLEAMHVAELHTGRAVESIRLLAGTPPRYGVFVTGGRQLMIDGENGRVISIRGGADESDYQWPGIRVVAHRGGVSLGPPENTLPAIAKAIEVGADLIEIDIRETADGHLVLMHDSTVDRTTDGRGLVKELTLNEILALEVKHDGEEVIRVPLLMDALRAMKGKIDADLDFKEGNVEKLLAEVREARMEDHATMHSAWERCAKIAQLEPRIRIRPTASHPHQVRELVSQLHPAMVNFDWKAVTEESVREAHLAGCLAFVNCLETADTDLYIREAIRMGADYIQSDRPDRVIEILKENGLRRMQPVLGSELGTPLRAPGLGYPWH